MVWAGRPWVQVPPPLPIRRLHSSEGCDDEQRQERRRPSSFDSLPRTTGGHAVTFTLDRRDAFPPPVLPAPMARPVVHLTRASLTAERLLFSHPTHHGCNPCQSRDDVRWAAPSGDESDRFNILSCRKRQRPFRSFAQLIDIPRLVAVRDRFGRFPCHKCRIDSLALHVDRRIPVARRFVRDARLSSEFAKEFAPHLAGNGYDS